MTQIDKCASLKFSHLRIIIRQEYRQKNRHCKEARHANNQKRRKYLLRYILFIQYQGYDRKMKRGKAFWFAVWVAALLS